MSNLTTASPRHWWRPLGRSDRRAMLAMVVVPVALFVVPALFGHAALVADNLIQNFPLRVLSGRQIASGHWPLFNPYSNSGTPLLGGMNAGALYPMTFLFAILSPIAAWVINLIVIYATCTLGMFALLRWHGLRTLASFAAAMSFTYTGAMIGQIVHLGVVQGFALLPWAILVLASLAKRLGSLDSSVSWRVHARHALASTLGFGILWGLTFLTGEPRAIAVMELLSIVCVPAILVLRSSYWLSTWRARVTFVLSSGVGVLWGLAIGLVQLLPGWSFIGVSQRSLISYWYYGAGSMPVRWTPMMLIQDMFGGNGGVGSGYFANYNLPEVTGYAGILAVVAFVAFLTRLTRRGWVGEHRDYVIFVVIGVVGLLATWGAYTPLGHVFHAIPLFGSTRLQSRNIILLDLAVSVLLGWWLDRLQARDTVSAGLHGRAKWLTLSPIVAVALCSIVLIGWGPEVVVHLASVSRTLPFADGQLVALLLHLALALAMLACLVFWLRAKYSMRWLLGLLSVDVIVFVLFCSTGLIGGNAPSMPSQRTAVAVLGATGRSALVDQSGAHYDQFQTLGLPNMNVFTHTLSVQGYGSLISSHYGNVTGTHPMSALDPCQLAKGTFAQLRLSTIGIAAPQLAGLISRGPQPTHCRAAPSAPTIERYFGQLLSVHTLTLRGYDHQRVARGPVSVQLLSANGQPSGAREIKVGAAVMHFIFTGDQIGGGVRISSPSGVRLSDATVQEVGAFAHSYHLDTDLQGALTHSSWRLAATIGTFQIFKATHVRPEDWLSKSNSLSRITSIRDTSWGDSSIHVKAPAGAVLYRSTAYLPGWQATAHSVHSGTSVSLQVTRSGLIQKVSVPSGTWIVDFHYQAPYFTLGLAASLVGALAMAGALVALVLEARRTQKGKVLL